MNSVMDSINKSISLRNMLYCMVEESDDGQSVLYIEKQNKKNKITNVSFYYCRDLFQSDWLGLISSEVFDIVSFGFVCLPNNNTNARKFKNVINGLLLKNIEDMNKDINTDIKVIDISFGKIEKKDDNKDQNCIVGSFAPCKKTMSYPIIQSIVTFAIKYSLIVRKNINSNIKNTNAVRKKCIGQSLEDMYGIPLYTLMLEVMTPMYVAIKNNGIEKLFEKDVSLGSSTNGSASIGDIWDEDGYFSTDKCNSINKNLTGFIEELSKYKNQFVMLNKYPQLLKLIEEK